MLIPKIRLSRILARVLRALYGVQPPSTEDYFTLAAGFTQDLLQWRQGISYLLDADGSAAMYVKLVLRQRDVLKLASCHAQILIYRPFLLKSFTNVVAGASTSDSLSPTRKQEMQQNIQRCVDAAAQITEQIDDIYAAGELYSTLFVSAIPSHAESSTSCASTSMIDMCFHD